VSIGRGRKLVAAAVPAALLLLGASSAQAATRYADPAGGGVTCSQALPCDIVEAVNNAGASDEVIVNPGIHAPGSTSLMVDGSMNVHGVAGQPLPQLNFSIPAPAAIQVTGTARVAHLKIEVASSGNGIDLGSGTLGEQLLVRVGGNGQVACAVTLATLRDSVCWAPSTNGEAVIASGDGTVTLRNLTAIGANLGLDAFAGPAGWDLVVDVKNTVFDGPATADIASYPLGIGSSVTVNAANSNYDTEDEGSGGSITNPGSGTNQTAAPSFVAAGAGDFHQLAGSPTIDAGVADGQLGTLDPDGNARNQGGAPDIGAFESDGTPPETAIGSHPRKRTRRRRARFTFTASPSGATFECKLDRRPFKPCTSPKTYRKLKPGRHTFKVEATDAFGNTDATPAIFRWRIRPPRRR
jgi:hypothetical protein